MENGFKLMFLFPYMTTPSWKV